VRSLQLHCTYARPDACLRARLGAARAERIALSREDALRSNLFWLLSRATYNERPEFVEAIVQSALANPHPQSLTGFVRQAEASLAHDTLERLHAIRVPTLVSAAAEDLLIPPALSQEVAARIPAVEFKMIEAAAHAYFWERADAFNTMCLEFLGAHATS
jgi:aminoacrylate hydrolase